MPLCKGSLLANKESYSIVHKDELHYYKTNDKGLFPITFTTPKSLLAIYLDVPDEKAKAILTISYRYYKVTFSYNTQSAKKIMVLIYF